MQDIPPIEQLPKLGIKCKIFALVITVVILFTPLILASVFWLNYDEVLLAVGAFLFLQIVAGVILSKMRSMSIPIDQWEISYSTYEISTWFVKENFC